MSSAVSYRTRRRKLQREALNWLIRYDGEFDWAGYNSAPSHDRNYISAVRDNLASFGLKPLGKMTKSLRQVVLKGLS